MGKEGKRLVLDEILSEKQIHHILKQSIGEDVPCHLIASEVKPAMDGIAGFLGEHMRAVLHVDVQGEMRIVHLFLKRLPFQNKPKTDFINELHYFKREELMYKIIEDICGEDGPNRFCVKAYVYTDSIIVMPDLTFEKYTTQFYLNTLNPEHVFTTTTSIARLHAAFVNYETKKSIIQKPPHNILQEFGHLLIEPIFRDCLWLRATAKLSANLLKTFSGRFYRNLPDLEGALAKKYIEASNSLREYKDTLNILLHKDLWVNNIMFKYENKTPTNAVLIDFQNLRYGPPAFDLLIFLYLNTDRKFRESCERDVFDHYYSIFVKSLSDASNSRLQELRYDKQEFYNWCEKGKMFAMLDAIGLYPYILLDPLTAKKVFDDPETHDKYLYEDRSEPVLAHALKCEVYKQRNLDLNEEFVETYLLNK